MKNYISGGQTMTYTNATAAAIPSGRGVLVGVAFGIAAGPIAVGDEGVLNLVGEYELDKAASQAWTKGAAIYWDNTNFRCTTAASGNTLIGFASEAVAGTATEVLGRVRLRA